MNIFACDYDPVTAAKCLDDRRVVKMVLETAQLLSGALYLLGYWNYNLYKPTHLNHPCTRWVIKSRGNFDWLVRHGLALGSEYSRRFHYGTLVQHKSVPVILEAKKAFERCPLDVLELTEFYNATTITGDIPVVEKYRKYLTEVKWKNDGDKARFTDSVRPNW
jgi:hypothetical protein